MIIRACCGGEGLHLCARGGGRTNQWMDAQRPDPRTIRVFPSRLGAGEASKAEPRRQEGGGGRRRLPVGAAEPEDQAAPPTPRRRHPGGSWTLFLLYCSGWSGTPLEFLPRPVLDAETVRPETGRFPGGRLPGRLTPTIDPEMEAERPGEDRWAVGDTEQSWGPALLRRWGN